MVCKKETDLSIEWEMNVIQMSESSYRMIKASMV